MNKNTRTPDLSYLNLSPLNTIFYQLTPAELVEHAIINREGSLTDTGALAIDTGEFTGRSPKDRFIVEDEITRDRVWWGDVNIKFSQRKFDDLFTKLTTYLNEKSIYVRDVFACADEKYRLGIRVVTETAFQNLFANNLFLRSGAQHDGQPEWTIIAAPGFKADPMQDGTRQHNFSILNFNRRMILIGGTGYTGEIKKGIFSVLNFILPHQQQVLSMHCSANVGKNGDTAVFFGLSGTGKTTLSADFERQLIGDDEHGWGQDSVFNFEGGCYAKTVDLNEEKEPQIYNAIRFGSLLENIGYFPRTRTVDYSDIRKTENTRVAYQINYIANAIIPSVGAAPQNIFFLTADAFGVLPPVSRLDTGQAMYHFISGYTAKVAGTEAGINEPQATFSACFGKAFLPLHPTYYATLLGKKLKENNVNVWLINTGWTGGPYGTGTRMKLNYTRAMITAAINGALDEVKYEEHPVFGLMMPASCPGVPEECLNPRNTWKNKSDYDHKANELAVAFNRNFSLYADYATAEMIRAAPKVAVMA